jgi:hypothetical protein
MTQTSPDDGTGTGAADDAHVGQQTGAGEGLGAAGAGQESEREVGVTAAVERGPAERSSEGAPVREDTHASQEGREPARSTDDL